MLKNFQKYTFSSIIITVIISIIILFSTYIIKPQINNDIYTTPFYNFIFRWFNNSKNWLILAGIFLIMIQATFLALYTNKDKLFGVNTFVVAILFIVLNSHPSLHYFSPVLISNTIIIVSLGTFFKTVKEKKSTNEFLKISILLAIASLFYFQYILIIMFAIVSIFIIRSKPTKEIFSVIFGFILVYVFFYESYFLINGTWFSFNPFFESISIKTLKLDNTAIFIGFGIFILLTFVIANNHILQKIATKEIEKRTIFQLLFSLFVFFTISYVAIPNVSFNFLNSLSIPVSILFGDYVSNLKLKKINKIYFILLIFSSLAFITEFILNKLF